jgi:CRP-like cAMP-binding protein
VPIREPPTEPTSTGALYELALHWAEVGDPINALRYYAETLRLNPEEARARRGIGACLAKLGRTVEAAEVLRVASVALGRRGAWLLAIACETEAFAIDGDRRRLEAGLGALHDGFAAMKRRRRHGRPPMPPQPVSASTEDSVVRMARPDDVIARAIALALAPAEGDASDAPPPPFFAGLSRASILALAPAIRSTRIERDQTIDAGATLAVVVTGDLIGDAGARFGPGVVIGAEALIEDMHRARPVRAATSADLLAIRRADIEELARSNGAFATDVAEIVKHELLRAMLATPMLEGLPLEARVEILGSFTSSIVPPGTPIIEQGSRVRGLYVIGSGRVQITRDSGDATAEIAAVLGPGEVFGEIALIDYRPATATAVAVEKSVVFYLDRGRFVSLTGRHRAFQDYLVGLARARLSENRK